MEERYIAFVCRFETRQNGECLAVNKNLKLGIAISLKDLDIFGSRYFSVSCYNWVSSDIFNKQIVFGMGKSL